MDKETLRIAMQIAGGLMAGQGCTAEKAAEQALYVVSMVEEQAGGDPGASHEDEISIMDVSKDLSVTNEQIEKALVETQGNRQQAARILGISEKAIIKRIQKLRG